MSNEQFESALSSLLKPQEKERLYKTLVVIRENVDWPSHKTNIVSLCEKGCLKQLVACLHMHHLSTVNIALSIIGNCCMERRFSRIVVQHHNILVSLNYVLKRHTHDSIRGRTFRIVGNMCQHWDQLANNMVEKEPQLHLVRTIIRFLQSLSKIGESDKSKSSEATILMAIRAMHKLTNLQTSCSLIKFGLLKSVGSVLIKYTYEWSDSGKLNKTILQSLLELIYMNVKYQYPYLFTELQNTDNGNAIKCLDKLALLSPYTVSKILKHLSNVASSRSDLRVDYVFASLIEELRSPDDVEGGIKGSLFRDYLKCVCFFMQQPSFRESLNYAKCIPALLIVLKSFEGADTMGFKNSTLLINALREYAVNANVLTSILKNGIVGLLIEKIDLILENADLNQKHEENYFQIQRKKKYSKVLFLQTYTYVNDNNLSVTKRGRHLINVFKDEQEAGPSSVASFSSGPSSSPMSSPAMSDRDENDSDSDNYSPVCSDIDCELAEVDDDMNQASSPKRAKNKQQILTDASAARKDNVDVVLKQQLFVEIVKLTRTLTSARAPAMEQTDFSNLLNKLFVFCQPWSKQGDFYDPLDVILSMIAHPKYLVGTIQTDFIFNVYSATRMEHGQQCDMCFEVNAVREAVFDKFKSLVGEFGKGEIAHCLYRAGLTTKQKILVALPFISINAKLLNKLMNCCGGLNILLQLVQFHSDIQEKSIISMCYMAKMLGVKDPSSCYSTYKIKSLPVNADSYGLGENCPTVVYFKLDDGNRVEADRNFLSAKSPYFNQLLSGRFKESSQEEIRLRDVSTEALKFLLLLIRYKVNCNEVYEFNESLELLLDVICLTDQYLLEDYSLCLSASVELFKFSPAAIPAIYRWTLETGIDILRIQAIAYTLVGKMRDNERYKLFRDLLGFGNNEYFIDDIRGILVRAFPAS